jgi:ubiquinone/menaquinone biosynthesis C-methylase UbiE
MTWGDERRFGAAKARLFRGMHGRCLMVAAGTGHDFQYFPSELEITAIDISSRMIERARPRAAQYGGTLELRVMDVQALDFADGTFDTWRRPARSARSRIRCVGCANSIAA